METDARQTRRVRFKVEGLSSEEDVRSLKCALANVRRGEAGLVFDTTRGVMEATLDPSVQTSLVVQNISSVGMRARVMPDLLTHHPTTLVFRVEELESVKEVAILSAEIGRLVGMDHLAFDLTQKTMIVRPQSEATTEEIVEGIARTGLKATLAKDVSKQRVIETLSPNDAARSGEPKLDRKLAAKSPDPSTVHMQRVALDYEKDNCEPSPAIRRPSGPDVLALHSRSTLSAEKNTAPQGFSASSGASSVGISFRTRVGPITLAIIFGLLSDVATKWVAVLKLSPGDTIEITPFFNLVLSYNFGVSFGLFGEFFADRVMLLASLKALIIVGILLWALKAERTTESVGLSLIAGGALGNLADRVINGAVTDFLDLHFQGWHWPTFNIADVFIFAGAVLLIMCSATTKAR